MRLTLVLLCLCSALSMQAQQLTGRVVAAASGKPIAFATIGVKGKSMGTTTDEVGRFVFAVPAALPDTDSVVISCIGFRALRLTVGQLRQAETVWRLPLQTQTLSEVQVRHSQLKPAIMGRNAVGGLAYWGINAADTASNVVVGDERGWEVATVLAVHKSCYVDSFRFYIRQNDYKPVRFRFVLYTVVDDKPAQLLLTDDIQLTLPGQKTGWTSLDLRSYNIHLRKGQTVAAGLQWLQGERVNPAGGLLVGPGAFPSFGHQVVYRDKSEAQWRSYPVNVSMYLVVQEYK